PQLFHLELRFQVIHGPARTPRPRPQCSPIIELARLYFVHEPDDAASQTRAIVWLNGYRRIQRKSPPSCEHLLLPLMRCSTQTLEESGDRKSTRLNSSHVKISYAVFCLQKKNTI